MPVLTVQEAVKFITEESKGRFFAVEFVKRSTGELRMMNCRTGVQSRRAGGDRAYDFDAHALISVFDTGRNHYRCIPIEGITRIEIKGVWHEVVQGGGVSVTPNV